MCPQGLQPPYPLKAAFHIPPGTWPPAAAQSPFLAPEPVDTEGSGLLPHLFATSLGLLKAAQPQPNTASHSTKYEKARAKMKHFQDFLDIK